MHAQSADLRDERARQIASQKNAIERVSPTSFAVRSQSGASAYRVSPDARTPDCTCPDATNRGNADLIANPCKHVRAVRYYLTAERDTLEGTAIERVPITYSQAWSAYNAAQTSEVRLFDALLRDLVSVVPQPPHVNGRPPIPMKDALFCAIQKVYSQLSMRRAASLFASAAERDQIERAPSFIVTSRILNRADVTTVLQELVRLSAIPLAGLESDFAIDSTGFRTSCFGSYCVEKHGAKKVNQYLKLHACVGTRTHVITAARVTASEGEGVGDALHFPPLLMATHDAGFNVQRITADKAYSSQSAHNTAQAIDAHALIPFKENAKGLSPSPAWKKAFHYFQLQRDEFEARYHKRSNVESTFSSIKRKFGETLKSKNRIAQENELLAKVIAYNITILIHEMHENGIDPKFLDQNQAPRNGTPPTPQV